MDGRWRLNRVKLRMAMLIAVLFLFHQNVNFCLSLNEEGLALLRFRERIKRDPFDALSDWNEKDGDTEHCFWFGVECSNGKVVTLHLKDLCLEGTLSPELGKLACLKSINLRNNSFFGNIPKEIGELKELEVLDLGNNNFSGPFPSDFANNLSLTALLLDNNEFLGTISPELYELKMLSEIQADENQLRASCSSRDFTLNIAQPGDIAHRMLLQVANIANPPKANNHKVHQSSSESSRSLSLLPPSFPPSESPSAPSLSPSSLLFSPSPSPSFSPAESSSSLPFPPSPSPVEAPTEASPAPARPSIVVFAPPEHHGVSLTPASSPSEVVDNDLNSKHQIILIAGIVGCSLLLLISAAGAIFYRSNKVVTVGPWATGLSGQLQKAFVTGVPKLKRSELEAACEDFSNIIGSFSYGTVYKGTLSSGVEIAVTSTTVISRKEWSKILEAQFRKKIDTLSKMNHKNFVNLIGYCEENEPFTRIMVFEYAPNGTLFEHLHIKEAEHLDWGMRLRIAMGMAYCLDPRQPAIILYISD
uniref:LRR-RLK n=1 Tax=Vernicia fordii TaxID=73154 RepID=A0A127AUM4_VERFO|nr:LRR-RLK [Vernicia fordii]